MPPSSSSRCSFFARGSGADISVRWLGILSVTVNWPGRRGKRHYPCGEKLSTAACKTHCTGYVHFMYFQALAGPRCARPRATYGWLMLQCCGQPCRITEEMILQPTTTDVRGFVFLKLRTHMPLCVYRDKHYMYMQITGLLYPNTHRSALSFMPAAHRSAIGWRRWLLMLCSPPPGSLGRVF